MTRARAKGFRGCCRAVGHRLKRLMLGSWQAMVRRTRSALFACAVWSLKRMRVRFLVNTAFFSFSRIGHLCLDVDCFIKEGLLGRRPRYRGVLLLRKDRAANLCLLNYWRRHLWVISSPFWCDRLARFAAIKELQHPVDPYSTAMYETATFGAIQAAYGDRPPLLRLTKRHAAAGEKCLRAMGLPAGAWFVCVHCREEGYDRQPVHRARNASIDSYAPAMEAVIARGGWCIRMGEPSVKPLSPLPGVIDYAHSHFRSDWMDIFLCARARFFLGCASGLSCVATVFGVPSAIANQALPTFTAGHGLSDLVIPKLLWADHQARYLSFPEIAASPLAVVRLTHCLELAGVTAHDNTAEDIRELALEMLDELEGKFEETDEDPRLQQRMRSLFQPGHYGYGTASRTGRRFLRKHRALLDPPRVGWPVPQLAPGCATTTCSCRHDPAFVELKRREVA
jgi:putative glycosyltransferase (TIGR04372 family)